MPSLSLIALVHGKCFHEDMVHSTIGVELSECCTRRRFEAN
jgi:hypothetical protein